MRKINRPINIKKTFIFIAIILLAYSCKPNDPIVTTLKPVITIQPADSVTTTSAVMVASLVPNGDASVSFQYKASSDVDWTSCVASGKYSGIKSVRVSVSLSNLRSGMTYNYKVTAVNATGSVTPDQMVSFTTIIFNKAIAVVKPVINLKINSVTLVAMVTANQDASTVAFEFKQSANTDWQSQSLTTTLSGSDSTQVSLDLASLPANTKYDYRVKVVNKAGEVVSGVNSFKTYAVTDYDGNYYHTITIGTQTWLQENLKTTHYANGDPISHVTNLTTWGILTTEAYCYYNNDPKIGDVYGALYNWYVGADSRGLIIGWHTPIDREFVTLSVFLDDSDLGRTAIMMMEVGNAHWDTTYRVATNSSGFTALPNGHIDRNNSSQMVFDDLRGLATFWDSTSEGGDGHRCYIDKNVCLFYFNVFGEKTSGYGLRLLKNN
jgi:uncharacterized protein (TIGR02145 family)